MVQRSKITVIGSANIDLVTETNRYPKLGETLLGNKFHQFPGGKGANQAVAASRLGAEVTFIGCVGQDDYGKQVIDNLTNESVNVNHVIVNSSVETGIANITVAEDDNAIIVVPGANSMLAPEHIKSLEEIIHTSDVVVLQLEIPIETVEAAVNIAYQKKIPVILNPAPAAKLSEDLLNKITYITPNESEIAFLTSESEEASIESLFANMYNHGSNYVIMTCGERGVFYGNPTNNLQHVKACLVETIDTTGAGDTFNAAFAVSIATGKSIADAIDYANSAAALSVTKLGAQTGMPTCKEVDIFISNKEKGKLQ
ncbi:ribokinase [Paucisalibacillus sp. EB02]|uniref:ribokinase n=1 Tax=Paucisalibacillus sp. EB02 TaxID=1347087 RepID=UPI0004B287CD|nr:ribokinase [Paucisalibacillus sp. EB02]